jgi:homoserine kinase
MAVKTPFSQDDFVSILSQYDLGKFTQSEAVRHGTVQTNFFIQTTQGKFVFRYYENRSRESVLFESELLAYLSAHRYPCPAPFKSRQGTCVGMHHKKPYVIFEFIAGQHIEHPSDRHKRQLIAKAAELQKLTVNFRSRYTPYRWNYDRDLCRALARAEAIKIDTQDAHEKFAWLSRELSNLHLPESLPKGICHCDFHFSNVLFQGGRFAALLDFDDANYTYTQFDLVGLIEYWAWPHHADLLDLAPARGIVQEYMQHRPLTPIEQQHLYDVYKLSVLIDCVWYFERGPADDFREKRKIDALTNLGTQRFFDELFWSLL